MTLDRFDVPSIVRLIEAAIVSANADAVAVWVLDERNQAFRIVKNFGHRGSEIEGMLLDSNRGVVSAVFTSGTEQIEQDICDHPERSMDIDVKLQQRTTAQLTIPLKTGSRVVAIMTFVQLFRSERPRASFGFSNADLELMRSVCELIVS